MTHPNEQFKLHRLSRYEVWKMRIQARWIVWKQYNRDFRYPVIYRYGRKLLNYIGGRL